jgi:RNA polymerase sigma factor (sigma-70 family)
MAAMNASSSDPTPADEQLAVIIAQAGQKAEAAFDQLYDRHARPLLLFLATRVSRSSLDDIHQEIWTRVWQNLPTGFHGGNFRAWLFQIARNHLIDLARRKQPQGLPGEFDAPDSRAVHGGQRMIEEERVARLRHCLEQLDARAQKVVRARLEGVGYEELASELNVKTTTVHQVFHRAKDQLQDCVGRDES